MSAYNGYLGTGARVMILGLLLVAAEDHMARASALKDMVIGASSLMAALALIIVGPVDWRAVAPLGAGMLAGGMIGPARPGPGTALARSAPGPAPGSRALDGAWPERPGLRASPRNAAQAGTAAVSGVSSRRVSA